MVTTYFVTMTRLIATNKGNAMNIAKVIYAANVILCGVRLIAAPAFAAPRHVNFRNPIPTASDAHWASAATNIQDTIHAGLPVLDLGANKFGPAWPPESQLAFQRLAVFGFSDDGSEPESLIQGRDGCFYGTASGTVYPALITNGLVFKLSPSGEATVLATFPPFDTNGFVPHVLAQAADGNLYGATRRRGPVANCGTVFRLTPAGERTNIFWFGSTNGCSAQVLVAGSDGNLYGLSRNFVFKLTSEGM